MPLKEDRTLELINDGFYRGVGWIDGYDIRALSDEGLDTAIKDLEKTLEHVKHLTAKAHAERLVRNQARVQALELKEVL